MNHLPEHRHVINGRTFSAPYDPAGFDPIRVYRSAHNWAGRLLAVVIGVALAVALVHWIDWSLT